MPLAAVLELFLKLAPHSWLAPLARGLSRLLRRFSRRKAAMAEHNLRLVYGDSLSEEEIQRLLAGVSDHTALMLVECMWVLSRPERLKWLVRIEGLENVEEARRKGRGVICWTAHLGNWELAGCRIAAEGLPTFAFIRRRESRHADAAVEDLRRRFGIEPVPVDDGIRPLARLLKDNWVFGHVADSPADEGEGQRVMLLGHPCYMWPTAIVLSLMTGAPVLPAFSWREPDGRHVVRLYPPIEIEHVGSSHEDVEHNFPKLVACLEEHIRLHPEQWAWYYERWYAEPGAEDRR